MENDYDRVLGYLKRIVEVTTGPERQMAAEDMVELLDLASHWLGVMNRDPGRKGDPFNLALLNWCGLDVKRRLPFVFKVIGLGDMKPRG